MYKRIARTYLEVRAAAAAIAYARTSEELAIFLPDGGVRIARAGPDVIAESTRVRRAAAGYTRRWRRAVNESIEAGREAGRSLYGEATLESAGSLRTGATTEASEAFNAARNRELLVIRSDELFKVWDSVMDQQRTCRICSRAHGTIVRLHDDFPQGTPGGVTLSRHSFT